MRGEAELCERLTTLQQQQQRILNFEHFAIFESGYWFS